MSSMYYKLLFVNKHIIKIIKKIDTRNVSKILAVKCNFKSAQILNRKLINEFSK